MSGQKRILLAIALALAAAAAPRLQAQQPTRFGGQLSLANDANLGIGVRMVSELASLVPTVHDVSLITTFDYFFPGSNVTYWELNGNAVYRGTFAGTKLAPYVGGGLNIAHAGVSFGGFGASGTRVGLNLMGGTWFETSTSVRPFLELRLELSGGQQFVVAAGLLF